MTEATVPDNMTGKTGRIQAGVTLGFRSQCRFLLVWEGNHKTRSTISTILFIKMARSKWECRFQRRTGL